MRNLQSLILPGVIIGIAGGILLFFAAYNFYPHKNVNINLNGDCYEFLDEAFSRYKLLEKEKEKELFRLQLDAIGNIPALIPITFSGSNKEVDQTVKFNRINVTERQKLGDNNTEIDKVIVRGFANVSVLEKIADNWYKNNTGTTMNIENTKIGILPNNYITSNESIKIRESIDDFMFEGIKKIIGSSEGIKPTECRSAIVYRNS